MNYFGGHEGDSIVEWFKTTKEGCFSLLKGNQARTYRPSINDISARLEVKYTPVRSDNVRGLPIWVVSKPIQKLVGRILVYSIPGHPATLAVKHILSQYGPFIEIDLDRFPERRDESQSFGPALPQILFNAIKVNGLKSLIGLQEQGSLKDMIDKCLNSEPPKLPKLPIELEKQQFDPKPHSVSSDPSALPFVVDDLSPVRPLSTDFLSKSKNAFFFFFAFFFILFLD